MLAQLAGAQYQAAAGADERITALAAAQGLPAQVSGTVDPAAFAGTASSGADLAQWADHAAILVLQQLRAGVMASQALATGREWLKVFTGLQTVDAGRVADGVALTAHTGISGYVRMLTPPSCARCVVLAGKWFRWNAGFERHPRCDCRHIPTSENLAGDVRTDPMAYFDALNRFQQDAAFGKAGAAAIRDGADIGQMVNARSGMYTAWTSGRPVLASRTGTSRRGWYTQIQRELAAQRGTHPVARPRLMPEQIYQLVGGDRAEAIRLLAGNGYLDGSVRDVAARANTPTVSHHQSPPRIDVPPRTPPAAGGGGGRVPPRRGMLGPVGDDEFDPINGWQPPARRSQIDDFDEVDASSVLDGDVGPVESKRIAAKVKAGRWDTDPEQDGKLPHGGHRFGTGWGKDEFPPGWREREVIEWVRAIVDVPTGGRPDGEAFLLTGSSRGIAGEVYIAPTGEPGVWYIASAHPTCVQ